PFDGSVTFTSNGGNVSAVVTGTAVSPTNPVLSVTPSSQDFGSVALGGSADRTFTVRNTGGGTLSGSASTSAPFSIVSGGSFSLGAGQSHAVVVRFSPPAEGPFDGSVTFTSNGGTVSPVVTGVSGNPGF
ncbi:MAG: choice-of-anchor D domain-containing protein, partial [Candidatus Rokubacteria bacterium]|nr:choice-of-anchor D domain-containing protein [Candidatus Rokubacteria bacterium]